MRQFTFPLVIAVFFAACTNSNQAGDNQKTTDSLKTNTSEDHSSEAAAIKQADIDWSKASEAKSVDKWLAFYADDAMLMPPNEKTCTTKAEREASIKNMFATPGMSLAFQTNKAEASHSGDLGYCVGVYQMSYKDAKGKDAHETGKYNEVWKKQSDGSWKCIVDIFNADPPAK